MPALWRDCLAGRRQPDLSGTRLRSEFCYVWRTDSISSRLGMIGARVGLRVAPATVDDKDRPSVLAGCPGSVARVDEQVISPSSLISDLADRHRERILRIDAGGGLAFDTSAEGGVEAVTLSDPHWGRRLQLRPKFVVFTAGVVYPPHD